MKNIKRLFFRFFIRSINSFFPKNKQKIMFASEPDFSDNARALYDYIITQNKFEKFTFVWLVKDNNIKEEFPHTIFVKRCNSHFSLCYIHYLYHIFTSKYLFCTHSHFVEANPKRQISVCLWHGTMLKRICAMNEREKTQPRKDQFRFFIAPSHFYLDFFCKSFLCKSKDVIVSGYPRNDYLFQDSDILNKLNIENEKKKIIVYMPTFRKPIGGGYSDSEDNKLNFIETNNQKSLLELSNFLSEKRVTLIIKWHPSDCRQHISINIPNIVSLTNKDIVTSGFQTYHLLHYADALITDYSSVFCDYMLLNRPIAFDISDIESYSYRRGLVFDNPIEFMPGYILKEKQEFIAFINDIANGIDQSKEKRRNLFHIYNDFNDNQSSKRLLDIIC